MKLYILKLYSDEHKFADECDIAGYYTSDKALYRALKKHSAELGIIDGETIDTAFDFLDKFQARWFNAISTLANVEIEETNTWTA